jgi:hypothetical protein
VLSRDFHAHPLYTRVEEAPGYMRMLERQSVVQPVVEAVIRRQVRQRKRMEIALALEYRDRHNKWLRENDLPRTNG